ncbi:D-alanine--D-alanine ligase [Pseudoduganella namucuonensis]|uniref:D-alanine--D-alanine ligase n=1 Tax=Pseudoduganella namucuonensis TaxID=1035707 RepID=A0A1I7EZ28_9BURK|nr:D-alanine--D-alanine ligase [Pseudoduganella namucuonensis]SFU29165.1 D-alanine-D-alanine ligase [Pseudoduganella namucuonensis]
MTLSTQEIQAFGKVGVLFGGSSAEREVSLMSGTGVLQALQSKGVDAHGFDPGQRTLAELAAEKFDRVFIALHGRYGEDGSIQGALELLGVPYTGSGVMASSVGMDKITTKILWLAEGLPTPRYAVLDARSDLAQVAADLGLPLIVKPPHEGSTIGITKVGETAAFQAAYDAAAALDDAVLAEEFVTGREFTVAVLGGGAGARALPVVEIVAPEGNYDYQNKYFTDDTKYFCPAVLDAAITAEMQRIAVAAYRAVGCEGWGRVDVLLREADNKPFLLEVNTSPGMTGHSLVPMAARAEGVSYEDLCVEILRSARLKMARVKE